MQVRLQKKWPSVFTDLCFYSDVSHLLGVYRYLLPPVKFNYEVVICGLVNDSLFQFSPGQQKIHTGAFPRGRLFKVDKSD